MTLSLIWHPRVVGGVNPPEPEPEVTGGGGGQGGFLGGGRVPSNLVPVTRPRERKKRDELELAEARELITVEVTSERRVRIVRTPPRKPPSQPRVELPGRQFTVTDPQRPRKKDSKPTRGVWPKKPQTDAGWRDAIAELYRLQREKHQPQLDLSEEEMLMMLGELDIEPVHGLTEEEVRRLMELGEL